MGKILTRPGRAPSDLGWAREGSLTGVLESGARRLHAFQVSLADSFDYDAAVIGAGSAGYAAARSCAAAGLRTVVLEGGKEVGGLCILRGCMPTKALLHCAEIYHSIGRAGEFGIRASGVSLDFGEIMARKDRLVSEFAEYRRQQLGRGPFTFIHSHARFLDSHTLSLSNGTTLRAGAFILCTGSVVAPSPVQELEAVGYLTSDDALALSRLPSSLIVLGGGAVAIEFAQFFARLGVQVTLVQRSPHILREMDEDASAVLEHVLTREGIRLYTGTELIGAQREKGWKQVLFRQSGKVIRVEAEEIFYGLGRVSNTAGLQLEVAGVSTQGGRILTSPEMQTTSAHIYAAGDCTGLHEVVHLAIQQAEVAAHNVANASAPRQMEYRLLMSVVFSDPQVATVGLTEKSATALGRSYLSARYDFGDHGKAILMEARDGFVKLLADPRTGEILGGAAVGLWGGELIHEIVAAMARRMTVQELAVLPHYHPTLAEIWTYPAEELADRVRNAS